MRKALEAGYIYIAQPPLYKISRGKKVQYAYNDRELEETLATLPSIQNLACSVKRVLEK